ncbi:MAG: lysine--tRNA ligase, partial [Acidobacteriota bacterium]
MAEPVAADRHWADRAAEQIAARGVAEPVVCTGISPSGPFHVGHLREIITGDALVRALRERGIAARGLFVVDDVDPLRKVYPFLDPDVYAPLVGRSLYELPAPCGGGTYERYYLDPFLSALERLHVDVEVVHGRELYASGRMIDVVFTALERRDVIAEILEQVTGRAVDADWSPWNPRCPGCGRL